MKRLVFVMAAMLFLCISFRVAAGNSKQMPEFSEATINSAQCVVDSVTVPEAEQQFPWEYLRNQTFRKAYLSILDPARRNEQWLMLSGPATPSKSISVNGQRYHYIRSCKQHECDTHIIHLLYEPIAKRVVGELIENGRTTLLGNPSPCLKMAIENQALRK